MITMGAKRFNILKVLSFVHVYFNEENVSFINLVSSFNNITVA